MIRSMTGYGKATQQVGERLVTVEIRCLNSKGADISLRLPQHLRNFELALRNEISRELERGKIDLGINTDAGTDTPPAEINFSLAKAYHAQITRLAAELGETVADPLAVVLKMPDIFRSERTEAGEEDFKNLLPCIRAAIREVQTFRETEGKALLTDMEARLAKISQSLAKVRELDATRLENMKKRIRTNVTEALGKEKLDENRFEQELLYYLEKLDINEEKVRLQTHIDYFTATCAEPSPGRKLSFISQEIGREINTIGSKANDAGIQKLVVEMKDELEKIKEQASNVL